ncbi:MAG: 50S ribosomal protein L11 methyltransferase [Oscillospiraceae bacterium]
MNWTDLILTVPRRSAETAEAVALTFADGGLYIEDYADLEEQVMAIAHVDLIEDALLARPRDEVKIHLYLSPEEDGPATAEQLAARLGAAGVAHQLALGAVRQQDWENAWKKHYHPLEIGRRLAVVPSWEAYPTARTVLKLDPGMAFGTGTHETTALCLEALDALVQGGERVLDVGCGSGILAVAALLLGAAQAHGIDIDPMAVRTAQENARLNAVDDRFFAEAGDLAATARGPYQLITANIIADAIIRLAPGIPPLLAPTGVFIASGVIDSREAEVAQALAAQGLATEVRRKGGWVAFVCRAQTP